MSSRAMILISYLKDKVKYPENIRQVCEYGFQHKNAKGKITDYWVLTEQEYAANKGNLPANTQKVKSKYEGFLILVKKPKTFRLAVTYEMCGYVEVEANSLEEAMAKFPEVCDDIELPSNGEYVDGSFTLSTDDVETMRMMTENS